MKANKFSSLNQTFYELRKQRGWSMAKLAQKLDTSSAYICQMERGCYRGSIHTIKRYAKAFGMSPVTVLLLSELLGNDGQPSKEDAIADIEKAFEVYEKAKELG